MVIKCFKCGTEEGKIVKHHLSYNPEVIVDCCWHCHQTIHAKVRRENKCKLTPQKAAYLSHLSETARYQKKYKRQIVFTERMDKSIRLFETVCYNIRTGNVWVQSNFVRSKAGRKSIEGIREDAPAFMLRDPSRRADINEVAMAEMITCPVCGMDIEINDNDGYYVCPVCGFDMDV